MPRTHSGQRDTLAREYGAGSGTPCFQGRRKRLPAFLFSLYVYRVYIIRLPSGCRLVAEKAYKMGFLSFYFRVHSVCTLLFKHGKKGAKLTKNIHIWNKK